MLLAAVSTQWLEYTEKGGRQVWYHSDHRKTSINLFSFPDKRDDRKVGALKDHVGETGHYSRLRMSQIYVRDIIRGSTVSAATQNVCEAQADTR